jgi:magnesium and cobalt transporter
VFIGDLDHVAGILYAKDLLRWLGRDVSGFRLKNVLRPALFVPESKPLDELLMELRAKKVHIAIVLNEFGSTVGLVTFEDILEEIVGEIHDEYEPAEDALPGVTLDDTRKIADVDAREYIADANKLLGTIGVELPEGDDYDTVGGYVLHALGHIPVKGEEVRGEGYVLIVSEADATRIQRVRVTATTTAEEQATGESRVEPDALAS